MDHKPNIVYLDAFTANPGDLPWTELESLGDLQTYAFSTEEEAVERAKNADIIITNKFYIHENNIGHFKNLKYIVVSATGYNNVQLSAATRAGISVSNVRGYSTTAVAQHVFSAIFALFNRTEYYNYKVRKGAWSESRDFCFYDHSIEEVAGKKMGIIGYGTIGKSVSKIAEAFGMEVMVYNKYGEGRQLSEGIHEKELQEIYAQCDIISLHVPLNESSKRMINADSLASMKSTAILINTSRGGLIYENALASHLQKNASFFALLDVLTIEPPTDLNFLTNLENCLVTPHHAWASRQARERLLAGVAENIRSYLSGQIINQVT